MAGGLIILAGILFSSLGRDLTVSAAASAHISQSKFLGGIVQGAILFTAVIIGLDQIGIEVSFLITLLAITMGAILGSLALCIGVGNKRSGQQPDQRTSCSKDLQAGPKSQVLAIRRALFSS